MKLSGVTLWPPAWGLLALGLSKQHLHALCLQQDFALDCLLLGKNTPKYKEVITWPWLRFSSHIELKQLKIVPITHRNIPVYYSHLYSLLVDYFCSLRSFNFSVKIYRARTFIPTYIPTVTTVIFLQVLL